MNIWGPLDPKAVVEKEEKGRKGGRKGGRKEEERRRRNSPNMKELGRQDNSSMFK
jgi:hypothetical protein